MAIFDKLSNASDTNRRSLLNALTPEDLHLATNDEWAGIFDELRELDKNSSGTIEEQRLNRELMRKIYPYYDLSSDKKEQEKQSVVDLFKQLLKSPVFKHAACRWEQTPPEKRSSLLDPIVTETAEKMGLSQTRLETYERDSSDLGYVFRGDVGNVFHLNRHPKAFNNMSFAKAMEVLCHELTHLRQHDEIRKIEGAVKDGTPLSVLARQSSSLAPHFMAPYFVCDPENLDQLKAVGYQYDDRKDVLAYSSHPMEKEAYFRGEKMRLYVQYAMDNGYGKGVMPNPYRDVPEKGLDPNSVKLGGFTEDIDPERHLTAGIILLKQASQDKKLSWDRGLQSDVRDGFRHFEACLKYGEYLTPSPAKTMLKLLPYYATQPGVKKALSMSGGKGIVSSILEQAQKSRNMEVSVQARITKRMIEKAGEEQQSPTRNSDLLREAANGGQGHGGEQPMDKHNGLDYRDVGGKDRKPDIPKPDRPTGSLEDERRKKAEEIRRNLGWDNEVAARRGRSL